MFLQIKSNFKFSFDNMPFSGLEPKEIYKSRDTNTDDCNIKNRFYWIFWFFQQRKKKTKFQH